MRHGRKPCVNFGNLFWRSIRPSGVGRRCSRSASAAYPDHLCGNETRGHSIHPDVVFAEFPRPGLRKSDHSGLGGGIVRLPKIPEKADNGGSVEMIPPPERIMCGTTARVQ